MSIQSVTKSYEAWMRECTTVVEGDLRAKHSQMKEDAYYFLRGTFYQWIQMWPEICPDLSHGVPQVLACGDLHLGSFGTWRDGEGRLCWGVDDFDEASPLPYTNDLVRLATSVKLVRNAENLTIKLKTACDAILEGYTDCLKGGGHPIVLAEQEQNLERLGIEAFEAPQDFWQKLKRLPGTGKLPDGLKAIIEKSLPPKVKYKVGRRTAGMGSRGQQRFVAVADWQGGCIAREAKAMVPSSCDWLAARTRKGQPYYQQIISNAVRSRDPFQEIVEKWLIRRLSPDSNPIDIDELPKKRDEETLIHAMGCEAANVHLGSRREVKNVLRDLRSRKRDWLRTAAKEMARAVEREWKEFAN
jgi:uncharacterized protein DUF2252